MKTATTIRSTAVLAMALAGLGALTTGCGMSTKAGDGFKASAEVIAVTSSTAPGETTVPGTPSGPAPTTTAPAPTTKPANPGPTTTAKPATPPPASPSRCTAERLTLQLRDAGAGMSKQYTQIVLTNKSGTSCTIKGFPGVSLTDAGGRGLGEADRDAPHGPVDLLTLAPGQAAGAQLTTVSESVYDPCGRPMRTSANIIVIPPDDTGRLSAAFTHDRCSELDRPFHIGPFQLGSGT